MHRIERASREGFFACGVLVGWMVLGVIFGILGIRFGTPSFQGVGFGMLALILLLGISGARSGRGVGRLLAILALIAVAAILLLPLY